MKKKHWHKWIMDIVEIDETINSRVIIERLCDLSREHGRTRNIPHQAAVVGFLKLSDCFERISDEPNRRHSYKRIA